MIADVEDRIAALAATQHGVVTRAQVTEAGLSRSMLESRLCSRRLRLLHRGVYLTLPFPLPHTAEIAAVLASGPGALLSHHSAAWVSWRVGRATTPVDVAVAGHRGRRPGIRAHRVGVLAEDERSIREGIPVTAPARTLLDLAAVTGARELEQAVARAEREGATTTEALYALAGRHRSHPGAPALCALLGRAGAPAFTRSEAEARFLALIREAGLPAAACNVAIGRYEVDFLWRAERVVVEVDGFQYHSSKPRFEGDRRKDAELVASGLTVLHLSWHQVTEEAMATAVHLGLTLARARERRGVVGRDSTPRSARPSPASPRPTYTDSRDTGACGA